MSADPTGITQEQKDQMLFFSLVQNFQQSAWIGLGKLADPSSNETEVKLDLAQYSIDMLAMLEHKTKGNLTEPELKSLQEILHALRLNYVDVSKAESEKDNVSHEENEPKDEQPESTEA